MAHLLNRLEDVRTSMCWSGLSLQRWRKLGTVPRTMGRRRLQTEALANATSEARQSKAAHRPANEISGELAGCRVSHSGDVDASALATRGVHRPAAARDTHPSPL